MRREKYASEGTGLKQVVGLLSLAFVVVLGIVVATRMSTDALGVLVGVVAGVAASIPTALLLMAVTRRRESDREERSDEPRGSAPPIIVVTPGHASPAQLSQYASQPYEPRPVRQRQFRVMGLEDEDDEPVEGQVSAVYWER
jgi:hypothetical protein